MTVLSNNEVIDLYLEGVCDYHQIYNLTSVVTKPFRKTYSGQDKAQQIKLAHYESVCLFDPNCHNNFYKWSSRFIHSRLIRAERIDKKVVEAEEPAGLWDVGTEQEDAQDTLGDLLEVERAQVIAEALDQLDLKCRIVICKLFGIGYREMNLREIGRELRLSHETVRRLSIRAIEQLRQNEKLKAVV